MIFIAGILATNLYIMVVSGRASVTWLEVITVRAPFSVYSGWVTAATILNMAYMMKSWGMSDPATVAVPKNPKAWDFMNFMMFTTEEVWTTIIIWVAELIYLTAAYSERNPLFGSVFLWVLSAILEKTVTYKSQNTIIITNVSIILGLHAVAMAALWAYSIFEEIEPWYQPLEFYNHGFLAKVDWWFKLRGFWDDNFKGF